ncbi:MAG: MerR family transcriptional regulator [Acidimicrobiia bacterium]
MQDQRWRQIGDVAADVGLSVKTLRYYDEVGLVAPSARSAGGFRLYTSDDVDRLRLVKHMKPLGFTLEQMRTLLDVVAALGRGDTPDVVDRSAVTGFADAAAERCQLLRSELQRAESFTALLRQLSVGRVTRPRSPRPEDRA